MSVKKVKIDSIYIYFLYYINTEMCNCNRTFDVRCTCWVNDRHWKRCPERYRTAYWRIKNWKEFYENGDLDWYTNKKYILKACKFNERDWKILMDMLQDEYDAEELLRQDEANYEANRLLEETKLAEEQN